MNIFYKISNLFGMHKVKLYIYKENNDEITDNEREYIDSIKRQNPFGLTTMLLGGISFTFGPAYVILPFLTIFFCIITFGTFDRKKEDNPWTFFIGFILSLIGLYMYLRGLLHEFII